MTPYRDRLDRRQRLLIRRIEYYLAARGRERQRWLAWVNFSISRLQKGGHA